MEKTELTRKKKRFTTKFDSNNVTGSINFTAPPEAKGAGVVVDLTFDDASTGPFSYHIHTHPIVPSRPCPPSEGGGGNNSSNGCDAAKGHLDLGPPAPGGGDKKKCDPQKPDECETGDLSGKHGLLPAFSGGISVWTEYLDHSIPIGEEGQLVGRSIVVHDASGARIACANIEIFSQKRRGSDQGGGQGGGGETGREEGSNCTLSRTRRRGMW